VLLPRRSRCLGEFVSKEAEAIRPEHSASEKVEDRVEHLFLLDPVDLRMIRRHRSASPLREAYWHRYQFEPF
jgi:hypothetical protein